MKIGYPCIPLSISKRITRKFNLNLFNEEIFNQYTKNNLNDFFSILKFNNENNIKFFRISSDIIPFGSHTINSIQWWNTFSTTFLEIGEYIKKNNMRVSMHPGQYKVLNSPKEDTVEKAINDLIYHCKFLDSLNLPSSHKIIIHIGGIYDSKEEATNRFIENYKRLPENVQNRIIIENDEKSYSLDDVLYISSKTSAPVVFDNLHNQCKKDNNYSLEKILNMVKQTWKDKDGVMKVHYSRQDPNRKIGSHCYSLEVTPFLDYLSVAKNFDMDIMLEIKDKDFAAIKGNNILRELNNTITIDDKNKELKRYELYFLSKGNDVYNEAINIITNDSIIKFYNFLDYYKNYNDTNINSALTKGFTYIEDQLTSREINLFYKYKNSHDFEKAKQYLNKLTIKYDCEILMSNYFFYSI